MAGCTLQSNKEFFLFMLKTLQTGRSGELFSWEREVEVGGGGWGEVCHPDTNAGFSDKR